MTAELQLHSQLPVKVATPFDYQADAEVKWVEKREILVCVDFLNDERVTVTLDKLCLLWSDQLATWITSTELQRLAKHVYPCLPQVHSGLWACPDLTDTFVRPSTLRRAGIRSLPD